MPTDFPPDTTVPRLFYGWRDDGTWRRISHHRLVAARAAMGGEAGPSAGVIDRQSVTTTEAGGPRGDAAGTTIQGRKRHILTDPNGLLVAATVPAAAIPDRAGAVPLPASVRKVLPRRWRLRAIDPRRGPERRRWRRWWRHGCADGGDAGTKRATALAAPGTWTLASVKRSDVARGFALLPQRWVVERTLAWLNRTRRLAQDCAALLATAAAWLMLGSVKLLMRRSARR